MEMMTHQVAQKYLRLMELRCFLPVEPQPEVTGCRQLQCRIYLVWVTVVFPQSQWLETLGAGFHRSTSNAYAERPYRRPD